MSVCFTEEGPFSYCFTDIGSSSPSFSERSPFLVALLKGGHFRVDFLKGEGKKRFLELSVSLFGKEGVYKKMRIAPIPSLFINGELFFDAIPPRHMLIEAIEEVLADKENTKELL